MKSKADQAFRLRMPEDNTDRFRKHRTTSRTNLHTRRSSDVCCQNNSIQHVNLVRPSLPIEGSPEGTTTLHKVQTTANLHDFSSWNRHSDDHWYSRPSDLFPPSIILQNKQATSRTLSIHGTMASFSNDYDVQILREQNVKLRRDNDQLRFQLKMVRDRLSEDEFNYDSIKNRLMSQRQEAKKTFDRMTKQLEQQHVTLEQTNKQKCLYQQIAEKLQNRLQILMSENSDLRKLFDHQQQKDHLLAELQNKYQQIKSQFQKLQHGMQEDDMDWEMHKHMWVQEKQYYKEIIRKLQFQVNQLSM